MSNKNIDKGNGQIVSHRGVAVEVEHWSDKTVKQYSVKRNSGHVVGDYVDLDENKLTRLERINLLQRMTPRGAQSVASNLSGLVVMVTKEPPPKIGFIDRALCSALAQNMTPILLVNKLELDGVEDFYHALQKQYGDSKIILHSVSVHDQMNIESLKTIIKKIGLCAFIGPSGVGKSSITNLFLGREKVKTGALSVANKRGKHTTSVSTLHRLENEIEWIDTPGIRDFGSTAISSEELALFFPGFDNWTMDCRFRNCLHQNEPGCSLLSAVADGIVRSDRLTAYHSLLLEVFEQEKLMSRYK